MANQVRRFNQPTFAIRAVRESMLFLYRVNINDGIRVTGTVDFRDNLSAFAGDAWLDRERLLSGSVVANNLGHEYGNHDDREDCK